MEAASIAAHGHDHHGPPPANRSSRVEPALLGMLLFINEQGSGQVEEARAVG